MATSYSYHCSSTMMMKNYKRWLHNWVSTPLNLSSLSILTKSILSFSLWKTSILSPPTCLRHPLFIIQGREPSENTQNRSYPFSLATWCHGAKLLWCDKKNLVFWRCGASPGLLKKKLRRGRRSAQVLPPRRRLGLCLCGAFCWLGFTFLTNTITTQVYLSLDEYINIWNGN